MLHPRFPNVEEKNTSDLDRPLGPSATRRTMMDFKRTSVLKTRRIPVRLQPPGQLIYIYISYVYMHGPKGSALASYTNVHIICYILYIL